MGIVSGGHESGRLEGVILQPDGRHALRLITGRASDGEVVEVPIDWVEDVEEGRVVLLDLQQELNELPEYVPDLPAAGSYRKLQP
jgi:hypothetical protein